MTGLSDAAVTRLKRLGTWPEFESGRYTALEEIGRGGMGTVYLAIDEELGRDVAIKIPNAIGTGAFERRLLVEARALARLEHPGIVPIHDVGRLADGRLFYVMKRVQGATLATHLAELTGLTERLRVFERICEPVAFAHARGFIHRDLKPENIMVGAFGEVMVMDWGIVKVENQQSAAGSLSRQSDAADSPHIESRATADDDHDRTSDGTVIGTRGFMAPEQAGGPSQAVDSRADVYGLGAILFLLLTGDAPQPDADPLGRLRALGTARPLAAICARALAREPGERYQDVSALSEDVARYRAGRAVSVYQETAVERLVRFGRTYRTAILLILAYIVMRAIVAYVAGR